MIFLMDGSNTYIRSTIEAQKVIIPHVEVIVVDDVEYKRTVFTDRLETLQIIINPRRCL